MFSFFKKSKYNSLYKKQKYDFWKEITLSEIGQWFVKRDINDLDENGCTILHMALEECPNDDIIKKLVDIGARPFRLCPKFEPPILTAISYRSFELIMDIACSEVDVNQTSSWQTPPNFEWQTQSNTHKHGYNPLLRSIINPDLKLLKFFHQIGLDLKQPVKTVSTGFLPIRDWRDEPTNYLESGLYTETRTCLSEALSKGKLEALKYLYGLGFSLYDHRGFKDTAAKTENEYSRLESAIQDFIYFVPIWDETSN
mgnify:CR=1 FL=1